MDYSKFKIIFLGLILSINCLQTNTQRNSRRIKLSKRMKSALENESIVADIIDNIPSSLIKVTYPSGAVVNLGNELTPTAVKDIPKLEWPVKGGALYTLAFLDPDAPTRKNPAYREVKHWLVINIPGLQINSGQTLAEFIGSGPPKGTGLHRYVYLVYKQQNRIETSEKAISNRTIEGRPGFKIRDFAKLHNLGQPIAVNFYQAQYDDSVPALLAQFGL